MRMALLAPHLVEARERKAAALVLTGAHVIRAGVARQLIDLMERGLIMLAEIIARPCRTCGEQPWRP